MRRPLVIAALVLGGTLAACGSETSDDPPRTRTTDSAAPEDDPGDDGWTATSAPPLGPREGSVAATVDGEAVFVGGFSGPPCPPNADCVIPPRNYERDGAAYDPASDAWRSIADAPRPVRPFSSAAVIGDDLFVLADQTLLVWHSRADAWEVVETPQKPGWAALAAAGDRLVLASGSDENGIRPDRVYEPATGAWSTLPEDPFKPAFDRLLTWTPEGLFLTAKEIEPDGGPADPGLVLVAVLPDGADEWRTLPVADQIGAWRMTWTGTHLVDPSLGGADGGEVNNYGRVLPYGGRIDPVTGEWSPLPSPPEESTGGWPVEALRAPVLAVEGWLYDDAAGTWTRLPEPEDAPPDPGPAKWVGDVLVVLGGADWDVPDDPEDWSPENVWSTDAWAYRLG
ncbi:hypothetical protein [Nocardioides stalactiti]|uniref:hypothetical protein n=1 Tax=Nocardioides stalactiti TaxID=2755356 RepID=UPI001603A77E|nr:hypothetical protein [Nocardioides stalactiti]